MPSKPPLLIWCIVLCYQLFGFNEFALRLPALISTIVFFVFFFKLISRQAGHVKAFLSSLLLLSCKAVLGSHVGITGDYDGMLLCFLIIAAYYFIAYVDFDRRSAIYLTTIFMGLAFYTKGTAAFIYLPGFVFYLLYRGKWKGIIKDIHFWVASLLFIVICISWIVLILLYGKYGIRSYYGSENAVETMLLHDTVRRLTSTDFERTYIPDHFFLFSTLDTRFNLWNYLFYISILCGLIVIYHSRNSVKVFIMHASQRLTIFSICITAPLFTVLALSVNNHSWYLTPVMGFIAFLTMQGILYITRLWRPFGVMCTCLFLFTFVRQISYLNSRPAELHNIFGQQKKTLQGYKQLVIIGQPSQHMLLYLEWLDIPIVKKNSITIAELDQNTVVYLPKEQATRLQYEQIKKVADIEDCQLMTLK